MINLFCGHFPLRNMKMVHILKNYLGSWTRARTTSMSMSVLISISLLSSLLCLRLTDGRPSSSNPDSIPQVTMTGSNDDPLMHSINTEENDSLLEKMREGILTELGITAVPSNPQPANISREEYVRAYTEYMTNVRTRRDAERGRGFGAKERRRNAILRVQDFEELATNSPAGIPMSELSNDVRLLRRDLEFDIQLDTIRDFQARGQRSILSLPNGCFLEPMLNGSQEWRPEVEVTNSINPWLATTTASPNSSTRVNLTSFCNPNATTGRSTLKIVTRHLPTVRRTNRGKRSPQPSSPTLVQKYQNKDSNGRSKDCDKTRHGKTCCRRSLRINFAELQVKDVVLEPKEFDAFMCVGRCNARRVPYSSTHAMFQHTLHQTRGKKFVPRPCCTPARLTSLDVIHTIPGSQMLQVTILTNAIVQECGCS